MALTHKEMTYHIRKRIQVSGIKARVSLYESCGLNWIRVSGIDADARFSDSDQKVILMIAACNGLTLSRGLKIDVNATCSSMGAHFVYGG